MNARVTTREPGVQWPPVRVLISGSRLLFIDNLRWTMIILVISMHAADTYSPLGNWYFVDRRPLSTVALLTFAAWQMYLQCFFMGLLFYIAGLFVPSSFDRKGAGRFIRDRAFRLGLPVLLYMFCVGPVTEYYLAHSWTSTEPTSFANEWIKHIRNGQFLQENGPLWFCLALLIFSTVYAALRAFRSEDPASGVKADAPGTGKVIAFAIAMGALTFLVRVGRPEPVLNMHLGDFPQYILLFSAGILSARLRWLPELSFEKGMRWLAVTLPAGFAAWLTLLVAGGALRGRGADFSGGWHWQSAALCFWESFTCVALCFGLLVFFRERFDSQGRFVRFLSENAFSVYVFHPPIVIVAARILSAVSWYPLIKFVTLTGAGVVASFALSAAVFRRIPWLRALLH
ncbi:MAG: acyltransferase [Bryobacteraceae bacterium]